MYYYRGFLKVTAVFPPSPLPRRRLFTGRRHGLEWLLLLSLFSVLADIYQVQRKIGYCPQFDALYDELTAREHLQLYSRLRGIPPKHQNNVRPYQHS